MSTLRAPSRALPDTKSTTARSAPTFQLPDRYLAMGSGWPIVLVDAPNACERAALAHPPIERPRATRDKRAEAPRVRARVGGAVAAAVPGSRDDPDAHHSRLGTSDNA